MGTWFTHLVGDFHAALSLLVPRITEAAGRATLVGGGSSPSAGDAGPALYGHETASRHARIFWMQTRCRTVNEGR